MGDVIFTLTTEIPGTEVNWSVRRLTSNFLFVDPVTNVDANSGYRRTSGSFRVDILVTHSFGPVIRGFFLVWYVTFLSQLL